MVLFLESKTRRPTVSWRSLSFVYCFGGACQTGRVSVAPCSTCWRIETESWWTEYKTETEIPDTKSVIEKQQQLKFHLEFNHLSPAQNVVGSPPPGDTRRKAKFPQPGIDQDQPLEAWETFLKRWAEYKKQMQVSTTNVAGQLILCGSDELQTSLQRIVGRELYNKTEVELLGEMKKLVVKYQNPAVYVEEFLTTK